MKASDGDFPHDFPLPFTLCEHKLERKVLTARAASTRPTRRVRSIGNYPRKESRWRVTAAKLSTSNVTYKIVLMMSFNEISKITEPPLSVFLGLSPLRPRCFLHMQLPPSPLTASNGNVKRCPLQGGKPVAQLNLLRRYTDL